MAIVITQKSPRTRRKSLSRVKVKHEFYIGCGGRRHTVIVTQKGRLILPHHPDLDSELAFAALVGEASGCIGLLKNLRSRRYFTMPHLRGQRKEFVCNVREKQSQRSENSEVTDPLLRQTVRERAEERLVSIAQNCVRQCQYRKSHSWNGEHETRVRIENDDAPRLTRFVEKKWRRRYVVVTDLRLPLRWILVWRRGLAVIKGQFVLDIIKDEGDKLTVLAARQSRGFTVELRQARVHLTRGSLTWLKPEPPNGQLCLPLW
jgi:hypothetical protein